MKTDLLASKLYFPPHRLDAGLRGKLTVVSAPAGFGKATLVSEWIRACGHPTAWLLLDKNDNDLLSKRCGISITGFRQLTHLPGIFLNATVFQFAW
jgi:hypothetical protein